MKFPQILLFHHGKNILIKQFYPEKDRETLYINENALLLSNIHLK